LIKITELARTKVLEALEQSDRKGDGLRVQVAQGGTKQVEFGLSFVTEEDKEETDTLIDADGFSIHLDPEAVRWLDGATIDFIETLQESGFRVDAPNAAPAQPKGELADAVRKVLVEKINPSIASHGGNVSLEGLEDNTAYLRFGGGCQGCSMIDVTLKQGVEVAIKEAVPAIVAVIDVTDHADGTNPYYSPGK
jgi:Fe/S biogenesis protein NfuA